MYLPVVLFKSCNPFVAKVTWFNWKSISSVNGARGKFEFLPAGNEFDATYPLSWSKYTFDTSEVKSYDNGTLLLLALFNFLLKLYLILELYQLVASKLSTVTDKSLFINET